MMEVCAFTICIHAFKDLSGNSPIPFFTAKLK